jgi:hypothetical protein
MTPLLALGCLGLAAWALYERGEKGIARHEAEWWRRQAKERGEESEALREQLEQACRNDYRDPKTGRFTKGVN